MRLSHIARGAVSAERARRRMELTGLTPKGHPLWTPPEVEPVVTRYPDYRAIFPIVERRTKPAVYSKAGRLGVTKKRPPPWSDNEVVRLRKVYPHGTRDEILAAFPGRTYAAVATAANARGVYRAKSELAATGDSLLDQILNRARQRNVSRQELDAACFGKGYFQKAKWRGGRFKFALHARAITFLGGTMRARWIASPDPDLRP